MVPLQPTYEERKKRVSALRRHLREEERFLSDAELLHRKKVYWGAVDKLTKEEFLALTGRRKPTKRS